MFCITVDTVASSELCLDINLRQRWMLHKPQNMIRCPQFWLQMSGYFLSTKLEKVFFCVFCLFLFSLFFTWGWGMFVNFLVFFFFFFGGGGGDEANYRNIFLTKFENKNEATRDAKHDISSTHWA